MRRFSEITAGIIAAGVLVLCILSLTACSGGGAKYREKENHVSINGGAAEAGPELRFTSCGINGNDVSFGVAVTGTAEGTANVTVRAAELVDAAYKDAGDVICYTGRQNNVKKTAATMTVPAEGHVLTVKGAGASDGKTHMITVTVSVRKTGAVCEGTLLLRDGCVLLSGAALDLVCGELTDEEMISLLVGNTSVAPAPGEAGATTPIPRLGIPALSLADGPQGVRLAEHTVWYPCGAVLASSWDRDNVYSVGCSLGNDCEAAGVDVLLGPGMNIQRVVLGGRNFEYFSEDPYLTGKIAAAYTSGVQSKGIGVSAKHYAVNNQETSRGNISVKINERALREIYLRGFGYLVRQAGPLTIMSSYNRVNGVYSSMNRPLLDVLRKDFGFDGLIMSDWGSGGGVVDKARAGNDLTEPGNNAQYEELLAALKNGTISREACVEDCKNVLSVVSRSKAYSNMLDGRERGANDIDHEGGRKAALEAAEAGMVLLKNEQDALPIKENTEIALIGMTAYDPYYGGGGSGGVNTSNKMDIESGLREAGYRINYTAASWFSYSNKIRKEFDEEAEKWADSCEAAIVVIGRFTEEGVDSTPEKFLLTDDEKAQITRTAEIFHAKEKKLIVLINSGLPVECVSWRDSADAILWIGYPGEMLGTAVADIVSGKVAPSGKLTCTWPGTYESTPYANEFPGSASSTKYRDDIYVGYRYYEEFGVGTAYCFGHGLTYTSFEYSDFKAKKEDDGRVVLSCTVKNTGGRSGREVVQFYVSKPGAEELLPLKKELCGFYKTRLLKPGEKETVTVTVTSYELESFFTEEGAWKITAGEYEFMAAASSGDVRLRGKVSFGETRITWKVAESLQPAGAVSTVKESAADEERTETRTSIAKRADTYCSGVEGSYVSANLVDGSTGTRWSAAGTNGERWVVIDLGGVRKVSDISLLWESNTAYKYSVDVSTDTPTEAGKKGTSKIPGGIEFKEVVTKKLDDWELVYVEIDAEARFIRVRIPAEAGWCSIYEISVFESN